MLFILFIVVVLVVAFVVLGAVVLKAKGAPGKPDTYYLRKSILSPAERSFLGVLEPNLPAGTRVLSKVRLADIFGVKSGLDRSERTTALNRINRKHVDFLLVRTNDLAPLAGIELDDASHDEEDRRQRDALVDGVFESAGLPLLHFPAQKAYNPAEIRSRLSELPNA